MEKFTKLTGIAAPLPMINVDTDAIIPKQYLRTIARTGLGRGLFHDLRYDEEGKERPDFVLNREPYRRAKILVAGENFGCGSSREHAPWALLDFGIRSVIAPSFADIFRTNCVKNGILPVSLARASVDRLMREAEKGDGALFTVDLEREEVTAPSGATFPFAVDPHHRRCLLNGLDEIALTLARAEAIDTFEERQRMTQPWLYVR